MAYLALTTFSSRAVSRTFFDTFKEAKSFAIDNAKEKVHVVNGQALFGDFKVLVYNLKPVTSNHVEIPVFVA